MKQILLVDDDTIVRLYLTEIVQWGNYGLEVIGAARNGQEALEMVHQFNPDIVLTDISMPKMDGIELIHILREEGYDGVIHVLSCHDDFELVKNAMKEGADDYLLKNNLNDKSIEMVIQKILEQMEKRQRKSEHLNSLQNMATKGMKVTRSELLSDIVKGKLQASVMEDRMKNAGLKGRYHRLIAVSIRPLGADKEQVDSLLHLCEQRLGQEHAEIILLEEDTLMMLIDLADEPSEQRAADRSNHLQTLIQRLTEQYLNLHVALASSAVCDGKDALADSLRQATLMQENSFYGAGRWRYGINQTCSSVIPEEARRFEGELLELLSDADDTTIRKLYSEALRSFKKASVKKDVVLSWVRDCDQMADIQRQERFYDEKVKLEDLQEVVEEYLQIRNQKKSSMVPDTAGPAIRRAVKYIYEHFDEPISQTIVSSHVNLTSTYFSSLFKQEMGLGFSEFVTKIRLEWVCNRLTTTNLTIKQISEDAGFPDYPYFCKTFKKVYQISPAEYRKRNNK